MASNRGLSFGHKQSEAYTLEFANNRAYVIGINAYSNGIPPLRTAVADAERLGTVLEESHSYIVRAFPREGEPTFANLRQLLNVTLPQEVGANDRVLVYFAGHGIACDGEDGPEGYLVPADANREERTSLLPMTELNAALAKLPCRHLLLILDCCFAGAFRWSSTRDLSTLPSVIHRERYERFIRDPAWQVITSAAYDQKALDVLSGSTIGERVEYADHSPFAAALFRALKGEADLIPRGKDGGSGGDGVITATELYLYLRECVETATEAQSTRQTPGLWPLKKHDKGEYVLLTPGRELNLPPAPALNEANNPYRGLQSFDEEHVPLFFGRSAFVAVLGNRVLAQPLTIVLGASGTGKSSVVKAGLIPFLRFQKADAWHVLPPLRPGKSPLASLAALALPGESGDPDAIATRLTAALSDSESLSHRLRNWETAMSQSAKLVIVVDQFEELLTLCRDSGEREQFLEQFYHALAAHADRLRVVLTLRSDFEPQFASSPLQEDWLAARIVVPVMTLDEYREAIEGPAAVKVLFFQGKASSQAFINRLIGDVANTPGALPLLSFTLSELYRRYLARCGDDRSLREVDYEALGGVGGSLRKRADEVYIGLPDEAHRATMKRVMLRMVSIEGGELARRRVPASEIVYRNSVENERVTDVLVTLLNARLIVKGTEPNGEPYVEPAHDALIHGWDKLLEWTTLEQEQLLLRRLLTPEANDWSKGSGALWHFNPRLTLAKLQLSYGLDLNGSPQRIDGWLNKLEATFVEASVLRRRNTFAGIIGTMAFVIVVLSLLTQYAFRQRDRANRNEITAVRERDIAESRRVAVLSAVALDNRQIDTALLLAGEACMTYPTQEAKDSMLKVLQAVPSAQYFLIDEQNGVECLALSPDGLWLASGNREGTTILWDVVLGKKVRQFAGNGDRVERVAISPDGRKLATASSNTDVILWDIYSGHRIGTLKGHSHGVRGLAFSPKGKILASGGGEDGQVILWDYEKLAPIGLPLEHPKKRWIWDLVFNATGDLLATASAKDRSAILWDANLGTVINELDEGSDWIRAVAFSSSGGIAAGGDKDLFVAAIDEQGTVQSAEKLDIKSGLVSLSFSCDGKFLAAPVDDSVLRWNAENWRLVGQPLRGHNTSINTRIRCVVFSPTDPGLLASCSDDGVIIVWNVLSTGITHRLRGKAQERLDSLAVSPDGKTLITASRDRLLEAWDLEKGTLLGDPVTLADWSHNSPLSVAMSPDGKMFASGFGQRCILFDIASRKIIEEPLSVLVGPGNISDIQFSPDGKFVAAACTSGSIVIWDVNNPNGSGTTLTGHGDWATCVAFEPSGKRLISGSKDSTIRIWDINKRAQLGISLKAHSGKVNCLAVSPDGKLLASGGEDNKIYLWDVNSGATIGPPIEVFDDGVHSVVFSPDGSVLAATSGLSARTVLWDVPTWRTIGVPLTGQFDGYNYLESSPSGRTIFTPDGRTLLTADSLGASIHDMNLKSWLSRSARIANRDFTKVEWERYFGVEVLYKKTRDRVATFDETWDRYSAESASRRTN